MAGTAPALTLRQREDNQPAYGGGHGRFAEFGSGPAGLASDAAEFNRAPSSPIPFSSNGATPEDRQRAVAKLLARGGSFSRGQGLDVLDLTPDSADSSPSHSTNSQPVDIPGAGDGIEPEMISFDKEEVGPPMSLTSGLSGSLGLVPRATSLDGKPIIQTPNRYAIDVPAATEYSTSGQRRAKQYKCSVFLPTPQTEVLHLSVKTSTTATQLVTLAMSEYLRTHSQPNPAMLGQPNTYRVYLAEDDGELDDSFPPLDPTALVSTTGADCFLLQRRLANSATTSMAHSVSGVHSTARPRVGGMSISDERSSSRGETDDDPTDIYGRRNTRAPPGKNRTSSDADFDAEDLQRGRAPSLSNHSRTSSTTDLNAPPTRTRSFTPFTWRSCLSCGCFSSPEEAEQIDPNQSQPTRRSSQG